MMHLPEEPRLAVRDPQRAQRVLGLLLWALLLGTLLGIGAVKGGM